MRERVGALVSAFAIGVSAGWVAHAVVVSHRIEGLVQEAVRSANATPRTLTVDAVPPGGTGTTPVMDLDVPDDWACPVCAPIVRHLAWSIVNEHDLWTSDGFYLERVSGQVIWIANGERWADYGPSRRRVVGRVASEEEHALLWWAAQVWVREETARR